MSFVVKLVSCVCVLFEGMKRNSLDTWLNSSSATTDVENSTGPMVKDRANIGMGIHLPVVFVSFLFLLLG